MRQVSFTLEIISTIFLFDFYRNNINMIKIILYSISVNVNNNNAK